MKHDHWKHRIIVSPELIPDEYFSGTEYVTLCCSTLTYHIADYAGNMVLLLIRRPKRGQAE